MVPAIGLYCVEAMTVQECLVLLICRFFCLVLICFKETFRELAQLLSSELPSGGSILLSLVNGYLSKSAEPVSVGGGGAQHLSSQLIKPGVSGRKALRTGWSMVSDVVLSSTSCGCYDEMIVVVVNLFFTHSKISNQYSA